LATPGRCESTAISSLFSGSYFAMGPKSSPRRRIASTVERTISWTWIGTSCGIWITPPCLTTELLSSRPWAMFISG
jgi:hypothetical protein